MHQAFEAAIGKWLYIRDFTPIDIIMAAALGINLPGDPIWLFVVEPPGGGKTAILVALWGHPRVVALTSPTEHSLISGLKGVSSDLFPLLDGKLLIFKDFTPILTLRDTARNQIFSDFRDAYDGCMAKHFGSGVGKDGLKSYELKQPFGLIAGVTVALERYRVLNSTLGERFLKVRLNTEAKHAIDKAEETTGQEDEMHAELREIFHCAFDYWSNQVKTISMGKTAFPISALGNIGAKLRSEVARDRSHNLSYLPEPEIGTRLTKQLTKLVQLLPIVRDRVEPNQDDFEAVIRVVRNSIPAVRMRLITLLFDSNVAITNVDAANLKKLPHNTAKEYLEDLWVLGLVERIGTTSFSWQLEKEVRELLEESRLCESNTQVVEGNAQ